jgi:hypothetical protein
MNTAFLTESVNIGVVFCGISLTPMTLELEAEEEARE